VWIEDVGDWLTSNWDWFDPSQAHRVFWPDRPYAPDMDILVAGCGPNQAAVIAFTNPQARVVGIDIDEPALNQEIYLRHKHKLLNLEVHPLRPLPIEEVATLGRSFDLIIASGVLHHLDSPGTGMSALADVLKPDGVAAVMLPALHLVDSPGSGFAVQDCLDLVEGAGMVFQDWFLKTPYYPPGFLKQEHEFMAAINALPERQMWSVMDSLRNQSGRHLFTACRPERPAAAYRIDFAAPAAADFRPAWRPRAGLDSGYAVRPGWTVPLEPLGLTLAQEVDGEKSIRRIADSGAQSVTDAIELFKQLWRMDFIAIDLSAATA
jgi:SAM-dependent methyltransferase